MFFDMHVTYILYFAIFQGITKLLLTKIPHYKEVILMSFNCDNCSYQNNEIQSGGMVQDLGIKYKVKIIQPQDLSRQIVKSDYASLIVPEIDLEVPPNSQKGSKYCFEHLYFSYSILFYQLL